MNLADTRVTILGLGLMGGSLALRLRGQTAALFGVDSDPQTVAKAARLGLVQNASVELNDFLPETNLLILATPVRATLKILSHLKNDFRSHAIILDLSSTKSEVVSAMRRLPSNFFALGGHPMCGKELSGLENADAMLYQDAPFILIPLEYTAPAVQGLALQLISLIGAIPVFMDAESHDHMAAATSHMPYLLSAALMLATPAEADSLIRPGLRSSTRLSGSSPAMMADILATNRNNVLQAINQLKEQLNLLESALGEPAREPELIKLLQQAQQKYQSLIKKESA